MSVFQIKQPSSRHILTESTSPGSTAGLSTAVFGTECYQIRIATSTVAWFVIDTAPSVSSTTILQTGALLPAGQIDYVTVTPGQRLSCLSSVAAGASQITITQLG